MSEVTRTEPTDLTSQAWLGASQYYENSNLAVDSGDLILDEVSGGVYYGAGYRISNALSLNDVGIVTSSNIEWASTEPTDTLIEVLTQVNDSDSEPDELLANFYNAGEEYSALTGGWVQAYSSGGVAFVKRATYLEITVGHYATGVYATSNSIDFTNIKKLHFSCKYDGNLGNRLRIGIGSTRDNATLNSYIQVTSGIADGEFTLDVSSRTGEYYVKFYAFADAYNSVIGDLYYIKGEDYDGNVLNLLFEKATSGESIPGINVDDDLSGKYLWVKQSFETTDTSATPTLESLEYSASSGVEISVNDTLSLLDDTTILRERVVGVDDTLSLSDDLDIAKALIFSVSDTLSLSDVEKILRERLLSVNDGLSLSDNIDILRERIIGVNDTLSLSDAETIARVLLVDFPIMISDANAGFKPTLNNDKFNINISGYDDILKPTLNDDKFNPKISGDTQVFKPRINNN